MLPYALYIPIVFVTCDQFTELVTEESTIYPRSVHEGTRLNSLILRLHNGPMSEYFSEVRKRFQLEY
jgi:hypothetical protein